MGRVLKVFKPKNLLVAFSLLVLTSLFFSYLSPYVHPDTLGLIPFFGLSYVIILSIAGCLLIIWAIMRSRWFFVVLIGILLGGNIHFRVFAWGSNDTSKSRTELKVMSYNVRLFDRYNPSDLKAKETKGKIFDHLNAEQPDIVCFQEFYHQDPPTSFTTKDSIKQLLKSKGVHERYWHKTIGRQNFGIAVFSKYPIIKKGDLIFSESEQSFNYCIYADIVKNNDTFRIYNVHLQSIRLQKDDYALFDEDGQPTSNESSGYLGLMKKIKNAYPVRAKQAKQVADHLSRSPYPVIVCGDFNDTPLSYTYNLFNRHLVDAFRMCSSGIGKTYAGKIPAGRIDYIFHSNQLGSKDFKIQDEALSDHYAIQSTIFTKEND